MPFLFVLKILPIKGVSQSLEISMFAFCKYFSKKFTGQHSDETREM